MNVATGDGARWRRLLKTCIGPYLERWNFAALGDGQYLRSCGRGQQRLDFEAGTGKHSGRLAVWLESDLPGQPLLRQSLAQFRDAPDQRSLWGRILNRPRPDLAWNLEEKRANAAESLKRSLAVAMRWFHEHSPWKLPRADARVPGIRRTAHGRFETELASWAGQPAQWRQAGRWQVSGALLHLGDPLALPEGLQVPTRPGPHTVWLHAWCGADGYADIRALRIVHAAAGTFRPGPKPLGTLAVDVASAVFADALSLERRAVLDPDGCELWTDRFLRGDSDGQSGWILEPRFPVLMGWCSTHASDGSYKVYPLLCVETGARVGLETWFVRR